VTAQTRKTAARNFELRGSPIQGQGAFATRPIRKGTRIVEYTGERIDADEADRRYDDDTMESHHTFLFVLNDDEIVDAGVGGNEARFINHSCAPNCEAIIESGRIFIYALRGIAPGEELVYDYAYERAGPYEPAWDTLYTCRCGAADCRGSILKTVVEGKKSIPVARARSVARAKAARLAKQRKSAKKAPSKKAVAKKPKRRSSKTPAR
jgi:uncharacterized protein